MSSRALRKLQKRREQEAKLADLQAEDQKDQLSDEALKEAVPSRAKANTFGLLNVTEEDPDDESDRGPPEMASTDLGSPFVAKKPPGPKKRKKKAAKSSDPSQIKLDSAENVELDEIDRALKALSTAQFPSVNPSYSHKTPAPGSGFLKSSDDFLAVEPRFLNAMNEMRKLFGNVVLESFGQDESAGTGRRRDRRREMIDLGKSLTGRYSPASKGQSLAGHTLRKNLLMQGKDEWPRVPSGGLGMEVSEKLPSGSTIYRIVHSSAYQDVGRQFDDCVESMDSERLILLLRYNPYHISTLLQVSDIAKHQGDHAVSADLLERALFNIGRSAHSSFGNQLTQGTARLDFIHAENRELWLAGWRYIANLGMKGTWRTAYEWAKLLLSLDTDDPYAIGLLIDNLAVRGREYEHFIDLCTQTIFSSQWELLPNIQCSLVLAYFRLNKPQKAREQLRIAMSRYPWVFCKLAQELEIQPVPRRIWGKTPPTQSHALHSELYISRGKDIWNTPEITSLVVEVADSLSEGESCVDSPEINLNIARHVIISEIPGVIAHLPSSFISGRVSASDPLPPYNSEAFRQQSDPAAASRSRILEVGGQQRLRERLEQFHNGDLDIGLFRPAAPGEDPEEWVEEDHNLDNERSLQESLLGDRLQNLQEFFSQYGVDRGNWEIWYDLSLLTDYARALNHVRPDEARLDLLYGPIEEVIGPIAVAVLEDEINMLDNEEDI